MRKIIVAILACFTFQLLQAQTELGAKAGLNLNTMRGKAETGESFVPFVGGNAGLFAQFMVDDIFGIKSEIQASYKPNIRTFSGTSTQVGYVTEIINGVPIVVPQSVEAQTNYRIMDHNLYLEVPLLFTANITEDLQVEAGPSIGYLMMSRGKGKLTWEQIEGNAKGEYELKYNYIKDEVNQPGAYADFEAKKGTYYSRFEVAANLGLQYRISDLLFLSGRLQYGLHDITNNFYDRSLVDRAYNPLSQQARGTARADIDRNITLQLSVGISLYRSSEY